MAHRVQGTPERWRADQCVELAGRLEGATLIETLLALAIGAMALTAFLGALSTGILGTALLNTQSSAQLDAQSVLEATKGAGYALTYTIPSMMDTTRYQYDVQATPLISTVQIITATVRDAQTGRVVVELEGIRQDR